MIICIWCCDANLGIGKNNQLPWHNKDELAFFKKMTLNSTVVMGRKTFDSINNKPLPNRTNIVLTKSNLKINNVIVENNIQNIINQFHNTNQIVYIIGGYQIYKQMIKYTDVIYVSVLDKIYDCDLFIDFDLSSFNKQLYLRNENGGFTVYKYTRK